MNAPLLTTAALVAVFIVVCFGPSYMIRRKNVRTRKELDEGTKALGKAERDAYLDDWMDRDARKTMRFVKRMDIVTIILLVIAGLLMMVMFLGPIFERQAREEAMRGRSSSTRSEGPPRAEPVRVQ